MMRKMVTIKEVKAIEILDSRGNPTVMTKVVLDSGAFGIAKVPSGASTGEHEALELRDGGKRYLGKGVQKAVKNVNETIAKAVIGHDPTDQEAIDKLMIELDGTEGKKNLGANAILSVSMATAVAAARHFDLELFQYIRTKILRKSEKYLLPVPLSNVINGGAHAGNDLKIQEFKILPIGAENGVEAIRIISEVYHVLGKNMIKKYGRMAKHVGDEGGYCGYGLKSTRDAFDEMLKAIEDAGYTAGKDVVLGIDAAASEFYDNGKYTIDNKELTSDELIDYYLDLEKTYPIKSVEDPFDENAFESFAEYTKKTKVQVITDDLTVSNTKILKKAIEMKCGNALLLKLNQIGSVTEAIAAAKMAMEADWAVVVSHRSGETSDTFIADLSVALGTGQIKTGAPARSDRVEKYNRLIQIYDILNGDAGYPKADFRTAWKKF